MLVLRVWIDCLLVMVVLVVGGLVAGLLAYGCVVGVGCCGSLLLLRDLDVLAVRWVVCVMFGFACGFDLMFVLLLLVTLLGLLVNSVGLIVLFVVCL